MQILNALTTVCNVYEAQWEQQSQQHITSSESTRNVCIVYKISADTIITLKCDSSFSIQLTNLVHTHSGAQFSSNDSIRFLACHYKS
jgi:hypothetical protein